MKLSTRRDIIREVKKRWYRQYGERKDFRFSDGTTPAETWEKLKAIDTETCDPAEIDAAIGNDSWSAHPCDECGKNHDALVHIGEEPDYEARWVRLCNDCLAAAWRLACLDKTPAVGGQ